MRTVRIHDLLYILEINRVPGTMPFGHRVRTVSIPVYQIVFRIIAVLSRRDNLRVVLTAETVDGMDAVQYHEVIVSLGAYEGIVRNDGCRRTDIRRSGCRSSNDDRRRRCRPATVD